MCGFLGVFQKAEGQEQICRYREAFAKLAHRGNSEKGELIRGSSFFFHHRLAFRDLAEGKQPLTDSQNRATIIFNGELYDFQNLRNRLAKEYEFSTRSDTEVILAAYLVLGESFLSELNGEYAFVIQDHRNSKILAARDPFGVKPLFWSSASAPKFTAYQENYEFQLSSDFCFASEIKGIPYPKKWDRRGLDRLFLTLFEEMGTTFENIFSIPPGSLFIGQPNGEGWKASIERKISKRRKPEAGLNFEAKALELKSLVEKSVRMKLDAEVPLGAYLSGGIDSRIAAHEMGKVSATIPTFTVGFEGKDYDESEDVRRFLLQYPNLQGKLLKTSNSALEYAYPHAIYASELVQPYTNGSAKWWLSRFARRDVRGVLTGDGADELFCGYPSYRYMAWWDFYLRDPSKARASLYEARVVGKKDKYWEKGLSSLPDGSDLNDSLSAIGWPHPLFSQIRSVGTHWLGAEFARTLQAEKENLRSYVLCDKKSSHLTRWQNYFLHTHFPTHVLNWVGDRMEMANTLEGRPVYLTQEILKFYQNLPDGFLVRGMKDKAILRKAYQKELGSFSQSPKKQFNAPFLYESELGHQHLSEQAIKDAGIFDPALVKKAKAARAKANPLEKSFVDIFLQNCLVTQMLDQYLVQGKAPERNLAYEEDFLDKNTVKL